MNTRLRKIVLLALTNGAVVFSVAGATPGSHAAKATPEAAPGRGAPDIQGVAHDAVAQEARIATEIEVEPSEVQAGIFFDGATLEVTALVPEGLEISVTCIGEIEPATLNRKGKAFGLIWMNLGEVQIDGTPNLYLLHTSRELGGLASPEVLDDLGVGYEALGADATLEGTEGRDSLYFREFLGLKESDGLYAVAEGTVERVPGGNGQTRVRAAVPLPPKTSPGEYRFLVHGFAEGRGSLLGATSIRVQQVGVAEAITTLAAEHGLLYGIVAVVVAIVVGLLTGVLFGLGSKKAH
ncbi:MAG: TIGR02186 family protein [Gemmatimonadota bacterium]|jgi:uncharacterized protein (TIGR02186 family)